MTDNKDRPEGEDVHAVAIGRPSRAARFLAFGLYFGLAPLACLPPRSEPPDFSITHRRQAFTLWAVLGFICAVFLVLVFCLSVLMVHDRSWAESRAAEVWILSFGRKCLLAWGVFWLYALWRCLRGSAVPVPFLATLSRSRFLHAAGLAFSTLCCCIAVVLVPLTFHANRLVTQEPAHGKVFMLYDDLGKFPRSLFSLAMYRLSLASVRIWGPESAVLLPLGADTIDLALKQGIFVFIGSHGTARGLLLNGRYYRPEDVPGREAGKGPKYVYLASCDSGAQRTAWEAAFRPATVKTYDRLTPTLEHLWWLWSEGPEILRGLQERVP